MESDRKNITQPRDWWAAFAAAARRENVSLSDWVGQCCRANLPADERRALSERAPAHRPRARES